MLEIEQQIALFDNIPSEMKEYNQWVVWKLEQRPGAVKPTKPPYDPNKHIKADVTNPKNWGTFEQSVKALKTGKFSGIGFVLTKKDPFVFIDIDALKNPENKKIQEELLQDVITYSEVSPSGKGFHLIGKGSIAKGSKRYDLEIYDTARYATMTGDIVSESRECRDIDSQAKNICIELNGGQLIPNFDPSTDAIMNSEEEVMDDIEVVSRCMRGEKGDLFKMLFEGDWQANYEDQSSADLALVGRVAAISKNADQTARIFLMSALGKRPKASRSDYMRWTLAKAFSNLPAAFDVKALQESYTRYMDTLKKGSGPITNLDDLQKSKFPENDFKLDWPVLDGVSVPPGLVGEIMKFVYHSAPSPIAEVGLMAGVSFVAGIAGQCYNIHGSGLNLYLMLLADTGIGKDALIKGRNRILDAAYAGGDGLPMMLDAKKYIGPSDFASGQALYRHLGEKSSCFSMVLTEFGQKLHNMASPNASENNRSMKRALLDLYSQSGKFGKVEEIIYASSKNNVAEVRSPSVTIMAESTPQAVFGGLTEEVILDGLLPRFWSLEFKGKYKKINKNHHKIKPDRNLIEDVQDLINNCLILTREKEVNIIDIKVEEDAEKIFDEAEETIVKILNNTDSEVTKHLWTRVMLKSMKLASIVAVGIDKFDPTITRELARWSFEMISRDVEVLVQRFEAGLIGKSESNANQIYIVDQEIMRYFSTNPDDLYKKYDIPIDLPISCVIGHSYLSRKLISRSAFKNDRLGATIALKNTLKTLEDLGAIALLAKAEAKRVFGTNQLCYVVTDFKRYGIRKDDKA